MNQPQPPQKPNDSETTQQAQMQTSIPLTLTLAQVNEVLRILQTGPYIQAKPLIEAIMGQAQAHVALTAQAAAMQPPQNMNNQTTPPPQLPPLLTT